MKSVTGSEQSSLSNAKAELGGLYNRVLENLLHSMPEIKKLAFDALDIRVYASCDTTEIGGVIPLELALPSTEQIAGCLPVHTHLFGYGFFFFT
jgi:hypothetical protein